jgi:hypothetical protein
MDRCGRAEDDVLLANVEDDVLLANVVIHLFPYLVRGMKLLGSLSRSIRCIERTLFTKIITRMDRKLRDESIKYY